MSRHEGTPLRKELKELFQRDLTPAERLFFLNKAREAVIIKGFRASEDLFYYCYFLTLRERLRGLGPQRGEGYLRLLLAEGMKDIEDGVRSYEERLLSGRLSAPDREAERFLEYLSIEDDPPSRDTAVLERVEGKSPASPKRGGRDGGRQLT